MQLEQVLPNKPSFGLVVTLFAVAIILIFIGAITLVSKHYHKQPAPPYTKHPVSMLSAPGTAEPQAA